MQINSVGYNNYGYSNQKAQRNNNQQSFGMAVNTLQTALAKRGTEVRGLGFNAVWELKGSLNKLHLAPTSAEFLPPHGVFIRDGARAFVPAEEFPKDMKAVKIEVDKIALKAVEHAKLKGEADKLPAAKAKLAEAQIALEKHNVEFIKNLVSGELSETNIGLEINNVGSRFDLDVANAEAEVAKAEAAQKSLDGFFNTKLTEAEIELLEGKQAPTDLTPAVVAENK